MPLLTAFRCQGGYLLVAEVDAMTTGCSVPPTSGGGRDAVNGRQSHRVVGDPDCQGESSL